MNVIDNQAAYWDSVAAAKEFTFPLDMKRFAGLVPPSSRILDYGCGYGRLCGRLREAGYRNIVGVDAAPLMIERARTANPDLTFEVLEEPPALPFAEGSFDAALLSAVLTCIPTDDGQTALIRSLARVLRPGGILYIGDYLLQKDARNLRRYQTGSPQYAHYGVFELPEGAVLRHHSRRWIQQLTAELNTETFEEIDVQTMNGHSAMGFRLFARKP